MDQAMDATFFDTHAHLDDEQFEGQLASVVRRANEAGVGQMIAVGTTAASSHECVRIAAEHAGVFASVGIQPNYCAEAGPSDWDEVVKLASDPNVVALGETGLDRYWDYTPFEIQQDYFDRHIRLSQQTSLPFIVHMRDCGQDIRSMLSDARERAPLAGVMHSFTGDIELAEACLELGLYISFAGMVTFKKSVELREVAAKIPDDRLLIETDAPYLSPHPKRGQRPNEPALVIHTAECLAEVRGVDLQTLAKQTTENARRLFRIKD